MIRLGGLTWQRAIALEFWQHDARCGVQFPHLSESAIGDYCVDRLSGAVMRPGRCVVPAIAANDSPPTG